jgi:hypothetical protein
MLRLVSELGYKYWFCWETARLSGLRASTHFALFGPETDEKNWNVLSRKGPFQMLNFKRGDVESHGESIIH